MIIKINENQLINLQANELGISNKLNELYYSLTLRDIKERDKWWILCGIKNEDILHDFNYQYGIDLTRFGVDEYDVKNYEDEFLTIYDKYLLRADRKAFIRFVKDYRYKITILPPFELLKKPRLVKNGIVIHFSNNGDSIKEKGFMYGTNDLYDITFTPRHREYDDEIEEGSEYAVKGYNFTYELNCLKKYFKGVGYFNYGNEAVIVNTDYIKTRHLEDNETECIFWGEDAKIMKVIKYDSENDCWCCNGTCNKNFYKLI